MSGPLNVSPGLPGGLYSALQVTAASVIKATPGILVRVIAAVPGSAGSLTLNDCATVGAASAANEILTIAFGSLVAGTPIWLEWPCLTGIVVSAVTTSGQFSISYT